MNTKQNLADALQSLANRDFETAAKLLAPVLQAKAARIVEGKKYEKEDKEDEDHDDEDHDDEDHDDEDHDDEDHDDEDKKEKD